MAEYFMMIGIFLAGLLCGFVVMGVLAGAAYNRGWKDAKDDIQLPEDVERYLNDLNLNEQL